MIDPAGIDPAAVAELLRALAHPVRLELLRALVEGERSVGDIEAATGVGQPGLSQQLAILRKAGLVETRREAKQIFYRINRSRIAELHGLFDILAGPAASPEAGVGAPLRSGGGAAMFARVG